MAPERKRPFPIGLRGAALVTIVVLGILAFQGLGLSSGDLLPRGGNHDLGDFFVRAFTPALGHETEFKPDKPLLVMSIEAAGLTFAIAAASMCLAIVLGVVLGFLASTAWWTGELSGRRGALHMLLARGVMPAVSSMTARMRAGESSFSGSLAASRKARLLTRRSSSSG